MYTYSMTQWLAFFFIYCFFGWCFESVYVSVHEHRWVNRGFMTGPYIPLYGSGAVLMLFLTIPVRGNYLLMYIVGAIGATVLEYITGTVMENLFGVRYWDYTDKKFNFRGRICLEATVLWGFFTLVMVEVIQPPVEHMVMMIRTGFPLALQSMLFPVANSIVQASVNTMGTDSIAAWSICDKLSMLIWLLADSMGPAMTTYVAQNLGAEQTERVKKGAVIGTGISVCAVGAVSLFLFFGSGWVGPWFIDKKDAELLIPLVVKYMQMMAPFYLFYAIAEALSGASCGLGETVAPMITTLLSICLLRVCSIWVILPKFETMECIIGIYIASWIVAGLSFIGLFWYKSRRKLQKNR